MQPGQPRAPVDPALRSALASVLLVATGPVKIRKLCSVLGASEAAIRAALTDLQQSLTEGICLQVDGDQARFVSAPENADRVRAFLGTERPPPLSGPALETLAIIAYRQPATRAEIEAIRGVNSDRAVQTLLARGLIEERGQRATLGRPMQYGTGFGFLEYFGLGSIEELPTLPEQESQKDGMLTGLPGLRDGRTRP